MEVKRPVKCARCGALIAEETPAAQDRPSHTMRCLECPAVDAAPVPVVAGVAGRSARAEHDRREAKRDAAITERWGMGLVAKVVRGLSEEPQSTRAWAIGAAGEEKLARELEAVEGLHMLHDRRAPGTRGNIDHILISRAGLFVVDAKNHKGLIKVADRGSLFRADHRLTVGGRDCSALADGMGWQVEAVRGALSAAGVDPLPPVTAVLCFLSAEWPLFQPPDSFRGVRLESHRSLKRLVVAQPRLAAAEVELVLRVLAAALPPR